MSALDPLKAAAVAEFAASVYRGGDADSGAESGDGSRERAVLKMAADSATPGRKGGILAPALRARLDAMDRDYAEILSRIDQMAIEAGRGHGNNGLGPHAMN